jgi:hypothetical protein
MKKKILLDRFKGKSVFFFYNNFKESNFDIKIITFSENNCETLKNFDGELLSDFEIARGSFFKDVPWILDNKDLEFFSKYEGLFQVLLSRLAISPAYFASHEMSTHISLLLNFWKYKLISKKIEICFAFYAPHDPSSFSLYLVTKLLKIPYIFIDMPIAAQKIRFMSCSYKYRNLLIHYKKDQTPEWVKKNLKIYAYKIKRDFENSLPPFMFNRLKKKKLLNKIKTALKNGNFLEKFLNKFKLKLPTHIYLKYNRSLWYEEKAIPGLIQRYIEEIKIFRRISKLQRDYEKICLPFKNVVINNCYIYFAAPLSPEGSNIPTALWNKDVKISILKILSVLPDDWKIVYKVNPFQFDKRYIYQFSSFPDWFNSDFYSDLLKTDKVMFVSESTATKDLIKNSMGVASINGTISIEAVMLKKHAIIFAPMWYDKMSGIHLCQTQKKLKQVINFMKNRDVPKPEILNLFFSDSSTFETKDYVQNDFSKKDYKIIIKKFISSYEVFKKLKDKKWSI